MSHIEIYASGVLRKSLKLCSISSERITVDSITSHRLEKNWKKEAGAKKTGRDRDEDRESMQLATSRVIRTFPRDDMAWLPSLAEQKIRAMHV